jgi:hypothetical protein
VLKCYTAAKEEKDLQFKEMFEEEQRRFQREMDALRESNRNLEARYETALREQDSGGCSIF